MFSEVTSKERTDHLHPFGSYSPYAWAKDIVALLTPPPKHPVIKRKACIHIKSNSSKSTSSSLSPCSSLIVQRMQPLKAPMPVIVVCAPKCPPSHFSSRLQQHLYIEKMRCNCEKDTFVNLRS